MVGVYMKKFNCFFSKKLSTFIFLICLVKTILFIIVFSGHVCISYNGFAVDKEENLYVGMPSSIKVYSSEGDVLRSFSPKTSRGYSFTIKDGEVVLINTGDKLYTLDLYGNILSVVKCSNSENTNSNKFISKLGNEYVVHNYMFRTSVSILDNGCERIVFKMPIQDYIVKLLDTISDITLFLSVCVLVFKYKCKGNRPIRGQLA